MNSILKLTENSKRIAAFISAVIIICLLFPGFAHADETFPADIRTVETENLNDKLVILHSNDVHGAIDGYAQITKLADTYRGMGAEVLLVDAGDYMQGDPYVNDSEGASAVELMNAAGYSFAALGNHEFDYKGVQQLKKNLSKAKYKTLCANIYYDGELLCDERAVYKAENGATVGLFGLDTPETLTKADPKYLGGIEVYAGKRMAEIADEQVKALQDDGAKLVIALTHLGVADESKEEENSSIDLYDNTKNIDFIIDGHSHTVMTAGPQSEPIQSTGTKFAYIGVVVVNSDSKIEDHYLVSTDGLPSDSKVEKKIKKIKKKVDKHYSQVVCTSELEFEGDRTLNRSQETNNGDLITDAMLWYADENPDIFNDFAGSVISLISGGAIRDKLPTGDVTKKDIYTVHPFGNTVNIVYVKGKDLLEALEAATFVTPEPLGAFPQTAGINFTIDTTKKFDEGDLYPDSTYHRPASINRVTIQSINDKPFDENAEYAVMTNDFIASGGDTYYVFKNCEHTETGVILNELLENYITEDLDGKLTKKQYGKVRGNETIITSEADAAKDKSKTSQPKTYVVKSGDCLVGISEKIYGTYEKWAEIYELNRDVIEDPELIYPGQEVKLPAA